MVEEYELIITFTTLILLFIIFLVICLSNKTNDIENNFEVNKENIKVVEYNNNGKIIRLCNRNTEKCGEPCFNYPCCVSNALEMLNDMNKIFKELWLSNITLTNYIECGGLNQNNDYITLSTSQNITKKLLENIKENYIVDDEENILNIYYSEKNKLKLTIFYNCEKVKLKTIDFYQLEISIPYNSKCLNKNKKANSLKLNSSFNETDNDFNIYSCFIINQKGRNDRLHHSIKECDKYNMKSIKVEAVNGHELNIEHLISAKKFEKVNDYPMTKNTIACSMSHIKALKMISELKTEKPCIIFEDDIKILNNFKEIMKKMKKDVKKIKWDLIFLGCRLDNDDNKFIKTDVSYIYKSGLVLGAYAYMVTPSSAKKILNDIYPIRYPIDITITIQDTNFITKRVHDKRFINKLKKYVIYTDNKFDDKRFGIVNELSTFVWKESSSS